MSIETITQKLQNRKDLSEIEKELRTKVAEKVVELLGAKPEGEAPDRREELEKLTKKELVELVLKSEKPKRADKTSIGDVILAVLLNPETSKVSYEALAWIICELDPSRETSYKSIASTVSVARRKGVVFPKDQN